MARSAISAAVDTRNPVGLFDHLRNAAVTEGDHRHARRVGFQDHAGGGFVRGRGDQQQIECRRARGSTSGTQPRKSTGSPAAAERTARSYLRALGGIAARQRSRNAYWEVRGESRSAAAAEIPAGLFPARCGRCRRRVGPPMRRDRRAQLALECWNAVVDHRDSLHRHIRPPNVGDEFAIGDDAGRRPAQRRNAIRLRTRPGAACNCERGKSSNGQSANGAAGSTMRGPLM